MRIKEEDLTKALKPQDNELIKTKSINIEKTELKSDGFKFKV